MNDQGARRPSFIIGGAPRSGTTLLCHLLDQHPDVFIIKPYIPEPKIFMTAAAPQEYLEKYRDAFAGATETQTLGEKTSYYLENEDALQRIAATLRHVRMLFIVREPVRRAYSNYVWSRKNGLETWTFEDAVRAEGTRANPLDASRAYARPFDYLSRGDYATFAQRYYSRFGREHVKFVLYEDLERRPVGIMTEIQEFIGIEPKPMDAQALGRINEARETGPPLDDEVDARLRRQMAPLVERFAAVSGLDVSAWGY